MGLLEKYGIILLLILLVMTVAASQSKKSGIRKAQNWLLAIFILVATLYFYKYQVSKDEAPQEPKQQGSPRQKGDKQAGSKDEPRKPQQIGEKKEEPDISPSFLNAVTLHEVHIPLYSSPQQFTVIMALFFPSTAKVNDKIGASAKCYLSSVAEVSLSSNRVFLTPKALACRNTEGQLFQAPVNGAILDSDGMVGIDAETVKEEEDGSNRKKTSLSEEAKEAARLLGVNLDQKATRKGMADTSNRIIQGQKTVTVVLIDEVTLQTR